MKSRLTGTAYVVLLSALIALMISSCSTPEEQCYKCDYSYWYDYDDGGRYDPHEVHKETVECGEEAQEQPEDIEGIWHGKPGTRIEVKRCE